jgi:hypothetical protein
MAMHSKLWQQHCHVYFPYNLITLAGFEPGIFCSVGGRDDHRYTPPVARSNVCTSIVHVERSSISQLGGEQN